MLRRHVDALLGGPRVSQPALNLAWRDTASLPIVAHPNSWDKMGRILRAKASDIT